MSPSLSVRPSATGKQSLSRGAKANSVHVIPVTPKSTDVKPVQCATVVCSGLAFCNMCNGLRCQGMSPRESYCLQASVLADLVAGVPRRVPLV